MKNKRLPIILLVVLLLISGLYFGIKNIYQPKETIHASTVALKSVDATIVANGTVTASTIATLHFQTGGKVAYAPFKEGDSIYAGQTIAQLDTYALQRQLTAALNAYKISRDTFDQTAQNIANNVAYGQQAPLLNNVEGDKTSVINDAVKRIADENQANLDSAVVSVELANYALQLATLTAPFSGVVLHEDITTAGQNITPLTGFTIADPSTLVFQAHVLASDIDFVQLGAPARVSVNGKTYIGTVVKIYPSRDMTTNTYLVDIQSDTLKGAAKFDEVGTVSIENNQNSASLLVPTWLILSHNSIWVEEDGKPVLKTIVVGQNHGDMTEVISGLRLNDKVISNPQAIAAEKYQLL